MQDKNWRAEKILHVFLALLFFCIPIEHKYNHVFRHFSKSLIPPGLELPFFFNKQITFYLSDLIVIGLFTLAYSTKRLRPVRQETFLLGSLFGCIVLSLALSPLHHYPVAYAHLLQLFTPIFLFALVTNFSFDNPERLFKTIAIALITASCFQSGVAIFQYFTQGDLGIYFLGERGLNCQINCPSNHRWIFDTEPAVETLLYRAMGTMCHPNTLGGLLTLSLFFTGYLFWKTQAKWLLAAYPIQCFALFVTYSRAALFAWIIGTLLWLVWMKWRQKIFATSVALLLLGSVSVNSILLHRQIIRRGGVVSQSQSVKEADTERIFYQKTALEMIRKHPLIGVGFGQFRLITPIPPSSQGAFSIPQNVHNIFLLLAAENGLPTLCLFLAWLALLFWRALQSANPETGLLLTALAAMLFISLCDHYLLTVQPGRLLFFGMSALLAQLCYTERDSKITFGIAK